MFNVPFVFSGVSFEVLDTMISVVVVVVTVSFVSTSFAVFSWLFEIDVTGWVFRGKRPNFPTNIGFLNVDTTFSSGLFESGVITSSIININKLLRT